MTSHHVRSISLPATLHPVDATIEDHFRRLRVSQAGPSSSTSISQNLCDLKDLYEQMNASICLPHNQQVLSLEPEVVEVVLDGSLSLLDISSSAQDALSKLKESVFDLQSALRRGSIDEGIGAYLVSRKSVNKALSKCLVDLKKVEKNCASVQSEDNTLTLRMLNEAEELSLATIKSLILFLMGKKAMSQTRGWSLVAKVLKSKPVSHSQVNDSEVEGVDGLVCALSQKSSSIDTKCLLNQLETLELAIKELEDGLEALSRCLVKTRVTLLNVLNY